MNYSYHDPTHRHLRGTERGLFLFAKCLVKLVVYSPLVITGYLLCTVLLNKKASGLLWLGLSIGFAVLLYFIVHALKLLILKLKAAGNYWWIPLFIVCFSYTCLLPALLIYEPVNQVVLKLRGNGLITAVLELGFITFVYLEYDFLDFRMLKGR